MLQKVCVGIPIRQVLVSSSLCGFSPSPPLVVDTDSCAEGKSALCVQRVTSCLATKQKVRLWRPSTREKKKKNVGFEDMVCIQSLPPEIFLPYPVSHCSDHTGITHHTHSQERGGGTQRLLRSRQGTAKHEARASARRSEASIGESSSTYVRRKRAARWSRWSGVTFGDTPRTGGTCVVVRASWEPRNPSPSSQQR